MNFQTFFMRRFLYTGKDGTVMFDEMFHSDSAKQILQKYIIGTLKVEGATAAVDGSSAPAAHAPQVPHMHIGSAPSSTINVHPDQFENFTLSKITKVSHDSSVFKFALPSKCKLHLPVGHHIQIWYVIYFTSNCSIVGNSSLN